MEAIIFRHADGRQAASLVPVLDRAGFSHRYVDAYCDDLSAFDPLAPDLLIVMGGGMGVYQSNIYPFLKQEIKILEERMAKDLPTIGICLGSQLMAAALGAKVYKGKPGKEKGWFPLRVNESGMKTPVRHFDKQYTAVMHWHGDTFDMPKGAVRLASSDMYENQAFSYGDNALALQFHPEVNVNKIAHWMANSYDAIESGELDRDKIMADTNKYCSKLMSQTEKFLLEFISLAGLEGKRYKHA